MDLVISILAVVTGSLFPLTVVMYNRIKVLQDNHVHDITERLIRLEDKLDQHILRHLKMKEDRDEN